MVYMGLSYNTSLMKLRILVSSSCCSACPTFYLLQQDGFDLHVRAIQLDSCSCHPTILDGLAKAEEVFWFGSSAVYGHG